MFVPKDLFYSDTHEWVMFLENGLARMGLTDFAQQSLGDIVYINLCMAGDVIKTGDSLGDVESIKAVSEIISPTDGVVTQVNEAALEKPELVNQDPYGAWLIEIESVTDKSTLINANDYEALIASHK